MDAQQFPNHGPLRRTDREIRDRAEIDGILSAGKILHLALADGGVPFVVPLFYAYDGRSIYFHSARAGAKVAMMKRNDLVCFEVSLEDGVIEDDRPCDFEARHRTAIGLGRARFVEAEEEKAAALRRIVARFTDRSFAFPPENLARTLVVRIDIESVKGKKHGF